MALQMSYDDVFGGSNPTAYFCIRNLDVTSKPGGELIINCTVHAYRTKNDYLAGKEPLKSILYKTDETNIPVATLIAQLASGLYTYMKTLPFFATAVDA